jgi:hypothetical protein
MTPTEHHHYTPEELHNVDVAHEHSDVNVRGILAFGVGMVAVTVVAMVAMWVLFGILQRQAAANDPAVSPLAPAAGRLPPLPRLDTDEPATLKKFRDEEAATLGNYGWVHQQNGITRIPIAEAKKKLLERGLPTRAQAAEPSVGTNAPSMAESSGGRTIK